MWFAAPLLLLGSGATVWIDGGATPTLDATTQSPWVDTDDDFLPDALEWVLLTDPQSADSDGDGVGDFIEAAQRGLPSDAEAKPDDHELRAVVNVIREQGRDTVWLHLLFRFIGTDTTPLSSLTPYVDWWGYRFPIDQLLGQARTEIHTRPAGEDGLFVRASFEIATANDLRALLPCTIGATAVLDGRLISTGSYVLDADGHLATLIGYDLGAAVVQTLAQGDQGTPFWSDNRVCLMRLAIVGMAPGGAMAEVTSATCVADGQLHCPPTCVQAVGQLMFFPDGLSTVTGGGVPGR